MRNKLHKGLASLARSYPPYSLLANTRAYPIILAIAYMLVWHSHKHGLCPQPSSVDIAFAGV